MGASVAKEANDHRLVGLKAREFQPRTLYEKIAGDNQADNIINCLFVTIPDPRQFRNKLRFEVCH